MEEKTGIISKAKGAISNVKEYWNVPPKGRQNSEILP